MCIYCLRKRSSYLGGVGGFDNPVPGIGYESLEMLPSLTTPGRVSHFLSVPKDPVQSHPST